VYSFFKSDLQENTALTSIKHSPSTLHRGNTPKDSKRSGPYMKSRVAATDWIGPGSGYASFLNLIRTRQTHSGFPLVAAFHFDDSDLAWKRCNSDDSFGTLSQTRRVRRCKAFDQWSDWTLLRAECSAAATLGIAYFFVLQANRPLTCNVMMGMANSSFDPWVATMKGHGAKTFASTRVTG
jgi:hypothetical protein